MGRSSSAPLGSKSRQTSISKSAYKSEESLNRELKGIIQQFSDGKPSLVFCSTKRACETAAKYLLQDGWQPDQGSRGLLLHHSASVSNANLKLLLPNGLAYHHAGLNASDRHIVEGLFLQAAVQVLFCTQTLALGVNLPARLVVVKGTTAYKERDSLLFFEQRSLMSADDFSRKKLKEVFLKAWQDGWEEYDDLEMLQIMGRAGRPQFDSQGTAVILTEQAHSARRGALTLRLT